MEQPGIKKQLQRRLTDIFGRVKKRDAMLGDLYYTLRTEEHCAHAETLIFDLAYFYHRSTEVADCLAKVIDHIDETTGPGQAYNLARRITRMVETGAVYTEIVKRLGTLEKKAEMEPKIRKGALQEIDRIRLGAVEEGKGITSGWFSYQKSDPVVRPSDLVLEPMTPYQFNNKLQNWGEGLKR